MIALLLSLLLDFVGPPQTCVASVFGYAGDRWDGGVSRCLGRRVRPDDWGIAMRGVPCGTPVIIWLPRTGRAVVAPIIDAGPFGAIHEGRWVLKRRKSDPGTYRGCADLTPPVARALGHSWLERVRIATTRRWKP